jgi:hypothetical protein
LQGNSPGRFVPNAVYPDSIPSFRRAVSRSPETPGPRGQPLAASDVHQVEDDIFRLKQSPSKNFKKNELDSFSF